MRNIVLEIACFLVWLTGIPWLLREISAKHKITIINYHDPTPQIFIKHIKYFSKKYTFINIDQVYTALEKNDFSTLPAKSLLITFDDGHIGNAELFSLLQEYRVPAVIYAVSGVIDTNRAFWFDLLNHGSTTMTHLKEFPDKKRRSDLENMYHHYDEREYDTPVALSAEQLTYFSARIGTVGAHTIFHPILTQCEEKIGFHECSESKKQLENMLNVPINHFAYPNGNYDDRTRKWLQKSGFKTARTTKPGWITPTTDPYQLNNFGISDNANLHKAILQTSGIWDLLKRIHQFNIFT